jgi:DNA-binding winged helix-turn-helix (wHTH) protein/predicted ATPase
MLYVGGLEVDLGRGEVRLVGERGALASRASDILITLAHANGEIVSKQELCSRVWRTQDVDDNRLQVHISTLRRLLGPDRDAIRTVAGRGYRLLPTKGSHSRSDVRRGRRVTQDPHLYGRTRDVIKINALLKQGSLVTLVGMRGVGKSRLAREIAQQQAAAFPDGVWHADLSGVRTHEQFLERLQHNGLSGAHASRFIAALAGTSAQAPLSGHLPHAVWPRHGDIRERKTLWVLNASGTALDVIAAALETWRAQNAGVHFLVTSREPLAIPGEQIHRVTTLEVPPEGTCPFDALHFASVRMFAALAAKYGAWGTCDKNRGGLQTITADRPDALARKQTGKHPITPPSAAVPADRQAISAAWLMLACELCRRVDGLPLAIEALALHCRHLPLSALIEHLDTLLLDLPCRPDDATRSNTPAALSIRTELGSTYNDLPYHQQRALRCLASISGPFSFAFAHTLINVDPDDHVGTADILVDLVRKAVIVAIYVGPDMRYRILAPFALFLRSQSTTPSLHHRVQKVDEGADL